MLFDLIYDVLEHWPGLVCYVATPVLAGMRAGAQANAGDGDIIQVQRW